MANILVIDDDPVLLDLISTILRQVGHQVTAIADPAEACESFCAGDAIDLLLTDITMRPISGFEVVKRLTFLGFHGSILFTSGYPALSGAVASALGERAIIEKPFTAAQLRSAVGRSLAKMKPKSHQTA